MNPISSVILGSGGHAKVVLEALSYESIYKIEGFISHDRQHTMGGYKVIGSDEDLIQLFNDGIRAAFVAVGDNDLRAMLYERLLDIGYMCPSIIHPKAIVSNTAIIEEGSQCCIASVLATESHIHSNTIINSSAVIEHECVIGKHSHIASNVTLAGKVTVGDYCFIGAGATVLPEVSIGHRTIIGAGAVVLHDIPDNVVAVGVPAKIIKQRSITV